MPVADFIEVYDDLLPAATCAAWLARFGASGQAPHVARMLSMRRDAARATCQLPRPRAPAREA